jgi:hypothetical protein
MRSITSLGDGNHAFDHAFDHRLGSNKSPEIKQKA